MERKLIFKTVHGSALYGLAHKDSDLDVYEVYEGSAARLVHDYQARLTGPGLDTVRGSVEAFVRRAASGAHQSVEAMFSRQKEWAPGMFEKWGAYVEGFRVTGGEAFAKYERTIRSFCYSDFKRRRHAVRLAFNLHSLRKHGKFNPELDGIQITLANRLAELYGGDDLVRFCGLHLRGETPRPQRH